MTDAEIGGQSGYATDPSEGHKSCPLMQRGDGHNPGRTVLDVLFEFRRCPAI